MPARARPRHHAVLLSFVLLVLLPFAASSWYLWTRAADRYASFAAFGIRSEEAPSAFELLGSVAQLTGGSSGSDTEILYAYIRSQDLVARIDARLDLRRIWSRADPAVDPVFAYHPPGTIEDLTDYWNRMVQVHADSGTGLIDLQVEAFDPDDALAIARAIYDESSLMINALSAAMREDATRLAREDLATAEDRLKAAREEITRFRNLNQLVDPTSSAQAQMGILSSLQQELASTLVDLDILRQTAPENDPRIQQAERRVAVIEERIRLERNTLGISGDAPASQNTAFADLLGEYERLAVELEFAERAYAAARTAHDGAVAEARRQSRYITAHIPPTRAESSQYPDRTMLTGLIGLFCLLAWALIVLIGYAIRDRR
ncbi:MAG: capsule biosynthesis protein [Rubellimicrobium sp.]|nr:capsule biosynthesis protein [Rubellimicrobium sp.]